MFHNPHIHSYSNVFTKKMPWVRKLLPNMIIQESVTYGERGKKNTEHKLNVGFWKNVKKPVNVVLDEVHTMMNSRRSMSKINIILTDWLALIRRVLGSNEGGYGELVLISQIWNRIDIIARDMATEIRYHRCHYLKTCRGCGIQWNEHSDMPEKMLKCPRCGHWQLIKHSHWIEIWKFSNMDMYIAWDSGFRGSKGKRPYFRHYPVMDIEDYFNLYDTEQWDNLFSEFYD